MPKNLKLDTELMQNDKGARKPQQGRSIASLNRMFNAAMEMMFERGNEDFTLQEVSIKGKVSIGSIYYRFKSKDDLVREVLSQGLSKMAKTEEQMTSDLMTSSSSLDEYVPRYVTAYSTILRDNALLMRLAMRHATVDPQASNFGNEQMKRAMDISCDGFLHFKTEISGDAESKVQTVFHMLFATLARHLNLDSKDDLKLKQDLDKLVVELGLMSLVYLRA